MLKPKEGTVKLEVVDLEVRAESAKVCAQIGNIDVLSGHEGAQNCHVWTQNGHVGAKFLHIEAQC